MGLDINHDTWHGAYSAFNTWRKKLAEVAGLPPLGLMEGFYSDDPFNITNPLNYIESCCIGNDMALDKINSMKVSLPIRWDILKPDVLHKLLYHSDCDGQISWQIAGKLAKRLKELVPLLPDEECGGHIGNMKTKTVIFISGCKLAYDSKKDLIFG